MWLTSLSISTFEKYAISVSIRCSSSDDSCLYFSAACFMAWAVVSFAVDSVGNSRTLTCNVTSWWGGRQSTFRCKSTIQWILGYQNERNMCKEFALTCVPDVIRLLLRLFHKFKQITDYILRGESDYWGLAYDRSSFHNEFHFGRFRQSHSRRCLSTNYMRFKDKTERLTAEDSLPTRWCFPISTFCLYL